MDITDGASSLAGSSSGPGPETAQPEAPNEPSESNEVSVYEDLHVVREIVLEGDRPDDLSDDDSAIGVDDDSDASSVASSAVAMEDAEPEPLEPPAEDHSVQRLEAHKEPVFAVAVCAARPEIFATGGGDDVAHLWRVGEAAPSKLSEEASTCFAVISSPKRLSILTSIFLRPLPPWIWAMRSAFMAA